MRSTNRSIARIAAAVIAGLLALLRFSVPTATADDRLPMGGGTPIVVNGDTMCTLTTIGTDKFGDLIGFTSAHCGGPGCQVAAEGAEGRGTVGTMVAGNDNLDYAVIKFDPAKVAPVADVNGFAINGIGPDPAFGQVACKLGRTTGNSCGVTWGPGQDPGTIVKQVCGRPGDSGAPVTVEQSAGRHDPRRVQRRPAHLRHQVHSAAHPGGDDVDQRGPGRHQRQEPAGFGFRPGTPA